MILSAKFITSLSQFDPAFSSLPEVAFLGRSNVGKSSLINALCKQKRLAKSSQTPGKTQLINFFEVLCKKNEKKFSIHFIDLPGFGYARVSKSLKKLWNQNLDDFLKLRTSIRLFIHLIDSRHTDLELDLQVQNYLKSLLKEHQKILKVFTKSDKLNQSQKTKLQNEEALLVSNLSFEGLKKLEEKILTALEY